MSLNKQSHLSGPDYLPDKALPGKAQKVLQHSIQ